MNFNILKVCFKYFYEFGDSESTAYADMTTEEKQAYQQRKKTARVLLYILFGVSLGLGNSLHLSYLSFNNGSFSIPHNLSLYIEYAVPKTERQN